jgi:hypothetical protein
MPLKIIITYFSLDRIKINEYQVIEIDLQHVPFLIEVDFHIAFIYIYLRASACICGFIYLHTCMVGITYPTTYKDSEFKLVQ